MAQSSLLWVPSLESTTSSPVPSSILTSVPAISPPSSGKGTASDTGSTPRHEEAEPGPVLPSWPLGPYPCQFFSFAARVSQPQVPGPVTQRPVLSSSQASPSSSSLSSTHSAPSQMITSAPSACPSAPQGAARMRVREPHGRPCPPLICGYVFESGPVT